jgi:hypothetical protein
MKLFEFLAKYSGTTAAIALLRDAGLLQASMSCSGCGEQMREAKKASCVGGLIWRCYRQMFVDKVYKDGLIFR